MGVWHFSCHFPIYLIYPQTHSRVQMRLRGDGTYDHNFHEPSLGFRNTCADNPGEWEYGHPTVHFAGVIGGWRLRCLGGILKGWGLWLRNFRAHDFQVNARGWRLGGLPCTIVAAHGSISAPAFPFTFKTHGVWFEPPITFVRKMGEILPRSPKQLPASGFA